jgi:hypothetical protein
MKSTAITIATLNQLQPTEIFRSGGMRQIIDAIKDEASSEVGDVGTAQGRKDIASMAHKVSKSKALLDKLGKTLADDLNAQLKPINSERKLARDELDALRDEIRQPLTDWEDAEKERLEKVALEKEIEDCLEIAHLLNDKFDRELAERQAAIELLKKQKAEEEAKAQAAMLAKAKEEAEAQAALDARAAIERLEREKAEEIERREKEVAKAQEDARREAEILEREKQVEIQRRVQAEEQAKRDAAQAIIDAKKAEDAAILAAKESKEQEEREILAREENKKHVAKINNAAANALVSYCFLEKAEAKKIVVAIARGQIPNTKINY